jgi:hypothetical protein
MGDVISYLLYEIRLAIGYSIQVVLPLTLARVETELHTRQLEFPL